MVIIITMTYRRDPVGPPAPFTRSRDPELLEVRSGGGCASIFGLPFLLAGLFIMQIPLGLVPMDDSNSPGEIMKLFLPLFGLPFVIIGGGLFLGRKGILIDRRRRRLTAWKRVLWWSRRKEHDLARAYEVTVSHSPGDSDTSETYPVRIRMKDGSLVEVAAPGALAEALAASRHLAGFLALPLEDSTTGVKQRFEPGRTEEKFRERARRAGTAVTPFPEPVFPQTRVSRSPGRVEIETLPPALGLKHYLVMAFTLVFVSIAGFLFLPGFFEIPWPRPWALLFGGGFSLLFIFGPIAQALNYIRRQTREWSRLTITPETVRLTRSDGKKEHVEEIPSDDVEVVALVGKARTVAEAEQSARDMMGTKAAGQPTPDWVKRLGPLIPTGGIRIRGSRRMIEFGAGLPAQELAYLESLVEQALLER